MIQQESHIRSIEAEFHTFLKTNTLGKPARFLSSTGSTNTDAVNWADDGAPEGALVFAEHQTSGRGRHGRHWDSSAHKNLLFSVVLRPNLPPPSLGLITVAASVALVETIQTFAPHQHVQIKWPNDILLDGKKCCGMLLESSYAVNTTPNPRVILGIGINLNQSQFPEAIAGRSTSLLLESGQHTPRMAFLAQFLQHFEGRYQALTPSDNSELLNIYTEKMAFLGEQTTLHFTERDEQVPGVISGIANTGGLILETESGEQVFYAGEVTTRK